MDDKEACTYCQETLDTLAALCLECEDFQLCLTCFSHGAQIGSHKNSHAYKLKCRKPPGQYSVTNDGLSGDDLTLVLDFVEQYSFGCWDELPKNTLNRTTSEIKSLFTKYFLDGTIGKLTWGQFKRPQLEDYTAHFKTNESQLNLCSLSKTQYAELGYNPIRDEFELENEYDNNAEATLNVVTEWNDLGEDHNLACTDIYHSRLQERNFVKELIHEYQLMDKYYFAKEKTKRKLSVDEKNLQALENQLKKFTRFSPEIDLWSLNARLSQEYMLKKRRDELLNYRKNGLTKLHEIPKFNLLHHSFVPDAEQSEASPLDNLLTPAPKVNPAEKKKKKTKTTKVISQKKSCLSSNSQIYCCSQPCVNSKQQ